MNNAGIFIRMSHRVHEITDMEWDLTLQTNLKGAFYCCKYVLPHMMEKGGAVVSISSVSALGGGGTASPYGISKAGLISLGRAVASEYAEYGIRSNVILPGLTDTPQARGSTGSTGTIRGEDRRDPPGKGRQARRDSPTHSLPGVGPVFIHHGGQLHNRRRRESFQSVDAAALSHVEEVWRPWRH